MADIIIYDLNYKKLEMFSCKLSQNENRAQHDRFYVFCNVSCSHFLSQRPRVAPGGGGGGGGETSSYVQ